MSSARFLEAPDSREEPWPALVVPKESIDAAVERLAAAAAPPDGRRSALIVHPRASVPALGLAPGIRVAIDVLNPGESTRPIRHNSTTVGFCIAGRGRAVVGGECFRFTQFDTWNTPSMATYWYTNDGDTPHVRLTYSNAALLEALRVHVVEPDPPEPSSSEPAPSESADGAPRSMPAAIAVGGDGAQLVPYEQLINPVPVASRPLHWPWRTVKAHLDQLADLGRGYVGRRLYLLYNPATGRTNGTTQNFFATITIRPPRIVDRPHRHVSAAINYFFAGCGRSTVNGTMYEWKAGDLMFSAPGWAVHNHASHDAPVYELTIQDSPLHIAMESLLWQEDLQRPFRVLGTQPGFLTNRG